MTHRDRSEYKTRSSVKAVCKSVTIPGMTGHVRRNTHLYKRICSAGDEELIKLSGSVSTKVRHLIHLAEPEWPTLMDTAKALGLSRRTLARRLESEGKQFQDMLDEACNELACWYLRQTSRSVSEIAELIGFSDQGNFSRGFRKWQGVTPSEYRRYFRP